MTMGSREGAIRAAAARVGATEAEYRRRIEGGEKWCTACGSWRTRDEFGRDQSRSDGLSSRCVAHGRRASPGPTKPERQAQAANGLSWCRHCEAWLPAGAVHGGLCREHANEYARKHYAKTNGAGRRGRSAARRRGAGELPPGVRELLMESTGGICSYGCGQVATTIDHVEPIANGGRTEPGFMVPACGPCNSAKKDSDPRAWIMRMTPEALDLIGPTSTRDGAGLAFE